MPSSCPWAALHVTGCFWVVDFQLTQSLCASNYMCMVVKLRQKFVDNILKIWELHWLHHVVGLIGGRSNSADPPNSVQATCEHVFVRTLPVSCIQSQVLIMPRKKHTEIWITITRTKDADSTWTNFTSNNCFKFKLYTIKDNSRQKNKKTLNSNCSCVPLIKGHHCRRWPN
jgi:hypothetical protein